MVLITLTIALRVLPYTPSPLATHTLTTERAAVWIFIPRSVFPIRTALPLLRHAELGGAEGALGSITSQTVAALVVKEGKSLIVFMQ